MEDDELMSAVKTQDKKAFAVLMQRHLDSLYGYAIKLTRDPASAEDLAQETWLKVWSGASKYNIGKVKFTTWLHKILYHLFVDQLRRQQHQLPAAEDHSGHDELWNNQAQSQTKTLVDRLLTQLPDNQRAALLLFHQQGFSTHQVATIMHLSVRATESLLARARRALRRMYTQQTSDEEQMS